MPTSPPTEDFIRLFTQVQRRLFLFILAQIPNPTDAEEILQEANVVIWSKADQFEPGTNFRAWAMQITSYEVMKFRQRKARDKHRFSDEFVSRVAAELDHETPLLDRRRTALAECLQKLRDKDRRLIEERYQPDHSAKDLAASIGRPANSVYQSIGRIRKTLLECINRQLALESGEHWASAP